VINTSTHTTHITKITKTINGKVLTLSYVHYTKRVMTIGSPEKSPESLAVELLREGEMCSL